MPIHANMEPNLLLSLLNMKMRNENCGLNSICRQYEWDQDKIRQQLAMLGWRYVAEVQQFKPA